MISNRTRNLISKINGNSVADHLVRVIRIFIQKFEIIRKPLYARDFSYRHTSVRVLLAFNKSAIVLPKFYHCWRLWVQLTLSAGSLNCKRLFVPCLNAISTHKNWRKRPRKILVIIYSVWIVVILISRGNGGKLQIPNNVSQCKLFAVAFC